MRNIPKPSTLSSDYELTDAPNSQRNGIPAVNHDKEKADVGGHDRRDLIRLGKRPVLRRSFGFMSILGFSCTVLITWECSLIVFETSFSNGGSAGLVYGFLFVWAGIASVYTSLGELASMAPTAGGQYHWVAMLAPASSTKFLSYLTGWFTVIGWQATLASGVYVSSTLIQGLMILTHPTYEPRPWHAVLLFWAIVVFSISINVAISSVLSKFEGFILILHVVGFVACMVPLLYLAPHLPADDVFNKFYNGGDWPTQGLSFMVGIIGSVFAFAGADGAVHMSEETRNASRVVPRSILSSIMINGLLGFGMVIATLFSVKDLEAAENTPTDYPFMEIFYQATGSIAGSSTMISIVIVMQLCADVGLLASSSRMAWSFARDRALPGWRILSKVNSRTTIPVASIVFTSSTSVLLSLIILGSSTAFNNLVSIGVFGLYASYFLAASLLLYRRLTNGIKSIHDSSSTLANTTGAQMVWGPWRVPGIAGVVLNVFALMYLIVIMFFCLWPPTTPVTSENMNYGIIVLFGVIGFCVAYYHAWAKKEYNGPIIEVTGPTWDE